MLDKYSYTVSTPEDAEYIGKHMRLADVEEIFAATGMDHEDSIMIAQKYADYCMTAKVDGVPVAMFGVKNTSMLLPRGCPWLLATDEMERHPIEVMKASRQYMREVKKHYEYLENYVDTRHETSIRWLQRFGFEVDIALPFGFQNLPFHRFYWHPELEQGE
jgi:hypothetical protein